MPRFIGQNSGAKSAGEREERESGMTRGRERRERI